MAWWEVFRVFSYAFADDPISKNSQRDISGAGVSQPDAIPDVRAGQSGTWGGGGGAVRLRDTNDFVDLSTVTNRIHRYKEYERLRGMGEIEMAMTVFADEACVAGNTRVMTPHGPRTIRELAETQEERFLVYCYDKDKKDYTLGWAFNPRKTKTAKTIRILMDGGHSLVCTPDHRIMKRDGTWIEAGELQKSDELMPFYRMEARQDFTKIKTNQFPRIWTHDRGWIHERQFLNEWTLGKKNKSLEKVNTLCRMISEGMNVRQIKETSGHDFRTIKGWIEKEGFSNQELKWLGKKSDRRVVISIEDWKEIDVYDLSVEKHENFATDWGIVHNCQKDDDSRVMQVICKNNEIKEELEYLLFHRKMLHMNQNAMWNMAKQLFIMGDFFYELVIDLEDPKSGIISLVPLPPDSMYRIETTKSRVVEFQQSKEGPDYQSLARVDVATATEADLQQSTAVRFAPESIIHMKIGDDRKTFYPYGVSLIESARGPAHQLRMMEDAMVVYRLTRAPERRVFYIDTGQLPPFKAEAFMSRLKDQLKKKKVGSRKGGGKGASGVEERWHAPAADEDFWIPMRPNSNTRVETLPGASNLGEVDDTVYFKNKLYTAMNFPKNYFNNEDSQSTRIALSAQDVKFARMIERLQSHIEDGFWQICDRHLRLLGFPEEAYEDLEIKMTPPSDWRELTRAEVVTTRINNAASLKGSQLMADFDILTMFMKYPEDQVKQMLARLKLQKLEDLKLQIIASNPALLGVGVPGPEETEVGAEVGGPNPMLGQDQMPQEGMPPQAMGMRKYMDSEEDMEMNPTPQAGSGNVLPTPTEEEIQKFNLDIKDYSREMDMEEIDFGEIDE